MNIERPLIAMEAEHGVLGALMHKPEQCEEVGAFLSPLDFSNDDNATLYSLILGCHSKKVQPDSITLAEKRAELPSGEMTIVYASEIMRNVPSAANGLAYARIVVERAKARKLYDTAMALMDLAQQTGSVAQQIAQAQSMIMELNAQDETPDVVRLNDSLGDVFDDMETYRNNGGVAGEKFGLPDLDKIVVGLGPGTMTVIAGRPGTGKTVLGMQVAEHVAVREKKSALIFSLEMTHKELSKRALASVSSVSLNSINTGSALMSDDACTRLTGGVAKMHQSDIRYCDKPALTLSRIRSIARFEHRAKPLSIIVIDYIGLIAPEPNSKHQNRNLELGAISRGLKALAKELGIPVVVLAQLNRGIEGRADKKPQMSDLRDSGEIEQDADVIIMAHRDMNSVQGQNGITEMNVVKCRHAQVGFCLLQFQGEYARFVSCAQEREEEQYQPQQSPQTRKSARSLMNSFGGAV